MENSTIWIILIILIVIIIIIIFAANNTSSCEPLVTSAREFLNDNRFMVERTRKCVKCKRSKKNCKCKRKKKKKCCKKDCKQKCCILQGPPGRDGRDSNIPGPPSTIPGPVGPAGICTPDQCKGSCECKCCGKKFKFVKNGNCDPTKLRSTEIYLIPGFSALTAYGYENRGMLTNLSIAGSNPGNKGLGIWCTTDHQLDSKHFIQFDVSDILKYNGTKCNQPTIEISDIKCGDGFEIGYTNTESEFGYQEYTYTNSSGATQHKTVNLFDPNNTGQPHLIRYISVRAKPGSSVVVNNIKIYVCEFGSECSHETCNKP